jgi:hypothetical protein
MQRNVLLAGCAAVVVIAGAMALRSVTRHEAGKVLDHGLEQLLANMPPGYTVRHGATDYNPLTGSATVHDLAVTRQDGTAWTAASLTVAGADSRALQDVFDPRAYPDGRPAWTDRRLLIADVSATNVHANVPGPAPLEISADRLTWHRLSGHPFAVPPTPENRGTPQFRADVALILALDSETASAVTLTTGGAAPAKLAIGSVDIGNYDAGKLGSAALKTIAFDGQGKANGAPVHLTIEGMDIKNTDSRSMLEAVKRDGHPAAAPFTGFTYSAADLTGLAVQVPAGPAISLRDVHAEQGPPDPSGTRTGEGALHGLTLALGETALPPTAAPELAAFGMSAITMDLDASGHSSAAARTADVVEDLKLHDLGTLHLQGSFSGYDTAATPGSAPMARLMATTIEKATIVWEDASLTDRLFKVAAVQMHSTPDMVRAQLAMPIVALGVMLPDQPDAADQVTGFLNHPGKLTITINPPQPVTIAQVSQAPATQRAHLLGVHITAN